MNILITGGAGVIGSHVVRRFLTNYPTYNIVNFDKLTYAGNLSNLKDVENHQNYTFFKGDICSLEDVTNAFEKHQITHVIHLAAESHVDRSIEGPLEFAMTNVVGTLNLLSVAKSFWKEGEHVFHHVSTDEVYGSLGAEGLFTEETPYDPRSPYSASKASSDHFVNAFYHTYGFPIKISNCSNNYGSHHFPEKLIPLMINNLLHMNGDCC
jgi:dTDP-glucose 4,6-dehydratase